MIRCGTQSEKCTDLLYFTHNCPFLYPFLSVPSSLLSLPLHISSSACIFLPTSFITLSPQVCKAQICLQLLDSLPIMVSDEVCFLSVSLLCLSVRFLPLFLFTASLVSYYPLFALKRSLTIHS